MNIKYKFWNHHPDNQIGSDTWASKHIKHQKTPSHALTFGYFWFGTSCFIGCRPEFLSNSVRVDPCSPAIGIPILPPHGWEETMDYGSWKSRIYGFLWYIHLLTHQSYCSFDICFGSALCTSSNILLVCHLFWTNTLSHAEKQSHEMASNMNKL